MIESYNVFNNRHHSLIAFWLVAVLINLFSLVGFFQFIFSFVYFTKREPLHFHMLHNNSFCPSFQSTTNMYYFPRHFSCLLYTHPFRFAFQSLPQHVFFLLISFLLFKFFSPAKLETLMLNSNF